MMRNTRAVAVSLALFGILLLQVEAGFANENVVGRPRAATITEQDKASARVQTQRTFDDPRMLSERVRNVLHIQIQGSEALTVQPLDGKTHPFTTKNASADGEMGPVDK